jgi:hypothetical protein
MISELRLIKALHPIIGLIFAPCIESIPSFGRPDRFYAAAWPAWIATFSAQVPVFHFSRS